MVLGSDMGNRKSRRIDIKLFLLSVILLFLVSCGPDINVRETNGDWKIIKSPISDKCYEAIDNYTYSNHHVITLGDIVPCK